MHNMVMAASTTPLTIDDFERLPAEMAEGHELVGGELVHVPGNAPLHHLLRARICRILTVFAEEHQSGMVIDEQEYDFQGNAHAPDVSFFGPAKRATLDMHKESSDSCRISLSKSPRRTIPKKDFNAERIDTCVPPAGWEPPGERRGSHRHGPASRVLGSA